MDVSEFLSGDPSHARIRQLADRLAREAGISVELTFDAGSARSFMQDDTLHIRLPYKMSGGFAVFAVDHEISHALLGMEVLTKVAQIAHERLYNEPPETDMLHTVGSDVLRRHKLTRYLDTYNSSGALPVLTGAGLYMLGNQALDIAIDGALTIKYVSVPPVLFWARNALNRVLMSPTSNTGARRVFQVRDYEHAIVERAATPERWRQFVESIRGVSAVNAVDTISTACVELLAHADHPARVGHHG